MLTTEPTPEMIAQWKSVFEMYRSALTPNRKSGNEVDRYFREKYPYQLLDNAAFRKIASLNITENEHFKRKLPKDTLPDIQSYQTGNAIVAIDLCTGEYHIESENIEEVIQIHDDLFVYRGLDAEDLQNSFLVAEYVKLSQKGSFNV